jgi:hypothetical protein
VFVRVGPCGCCAASAAAQNSAKTRFFIEKCAFLLDFGPIWAILGGFGGFSCPADAGRRNTDKHGPTPTDTDFAECFRALGFWLFARRAAASVWLLRRVSGGAKQRKTGQKTAFWGENGRFWAIFLAPLTRGAGTRTNIPSRACGTGQADFWECFRALGFWLLARGGSIDTQS